MIKEKEAIKMNSNKAVIAIMMSLLVVSSALMVSPVIAHPADGTVKYWALIVSGSGDRDTFTANTDYMYHVIGDHSNFNGVYYLAPDPSHHGVNAEATKANVRSAITNWLATRSDDDDIVFIYFSSHGAGYHTTDGLEGGRLDASGDEDNEHQEDTIVMKCWVLNSANNDVDGDDLRDDFVRNIDADPYLEFDLDHDGTFEGELNIKVDYDGDGNADDLFIDPDSDDQCDIAIDANVALTSDGEDTNNDGKIIGVDLNGDGDQNDWVGYDEHISLNNQDWTRAEKYWDDELASDLNTLQYDKLIFVRQGCVDPPAMEKAREAFVREGCVAFSKSLSCFGGGLIDDISAPDRIILTATNETTYSYGDNLLHPDGYSQWSEVFIDALHGENTHWVGGCIINEDPIEWIDADANDDGHVSIKEAWGYAWNNDNTRPWETPWLDDDGNGQPTFINGADQLDPDDGAIADSIWLPFRSGPVNRSMADGLAYLRCHQNLDGSWTGSYGKNVGYTSLAALTFLNYGIDESDPTVSKAMNYILSNQHGDGSIYVSYSNYETSLAILPLVAAHNSSYDDDIAAARNFLVNIQNDEGEGLTNSNWTYGGWGYAGNSPGWSDLSNTQWPLMGLDAAGLSKTSNTWSKGELYVTRCQNLQATNPEYDVTNDGGFTYQPPNISCCWGYNGDPKHSYGAITAAGVWSLKLTDVDTSDQRVQGGLNWLRNNYAPIDTVQNPGIGNTYLYYYLLSFAKVLIMTDIPAGSWQETASQDITNYIVSQQYDDGHWTSNEGDLFATEQAILALQTRTIPTDIQRLSWTTFILRSNADLHVYDPLGRHVGMNYDTGEIEIQIPNATYSVDPQNITIPELIPGNYRIVLIGTGTGEYTLDVTGGVGDEIVSDDSFTSTISEGEVHDANVNVAMITWLTIHIDEPEPTDAMVQSATGTGNVSFVSDSGTIEDLTALNESDLPEENPSVDFPHGLFSFNITGLTDGETVNVTIDFPQDIPTTAQYWKYHTPEGWYQIPILSNDGDNIITIQLTDGGIGDDDSVANGVIVDDGGLGISANIPKLIKNSTISKLESAKTGNCSVDREIRQTIWFINNSLDDKFWINETHLEPVFGKIVFAKEHAAVENMQRNILKRRMPEEVKEVFREVIDDLVSADEMLAKTAIEDAKAIIVENPHKQGIINKSIEMAEDDMAKAYEEIDKGRPDRAIVRFGLVWEHAQHAIKIA